VSAPEHAETAAQAWAEAVRAQRSAEPDHADFYAIGAELVATLHALQDMAALLRGQVAGYAHGRAIYDDSRTVDPVLRLAEAADLLAQLRDDLSPALQKANRYWSAISHIGVEAPL
jgi:hypothetical protein